MHHPFHIHGAGRFIILSRDGEPEANLVWKDTVLFAPERPSTSCSTSPIPGCGWRTATSPNTTKRHDVQLRRRETPRGPTMTTHTGRAESSSATPVLWGIVFGVHQTGGTPRFWWLDRPRSTHHDRPDRCGLHRLRGGGRTTEGHRRRDLRASAFVVLAAAASRNGMASRDRVRRPRAQGLWQHRTHFVANTRWWPPFCATVDFLVTAIIAFEIIAGLNLHG